MKRLNVIQAVWGIGDRVIQMTDIAQRELDNRHFMFASSHLGDPCPGVKKKLRIRYDYDGQTYDEEFPEFSVAIPSPYLSSIDEAHDFEILSAEYGINDTWAYITDQVKWTCHSPFEPFGLRYEVNPNPHFRKVVVIVFKAEGKICVHSRDEGDWLPLRWNPSWFLRRMPDLLKHVRAADPQNDESLNRAMLLSGLSDYSYYNLPPSLVGYCGRGLSIWQYPCQFVPYLMKIASFNPKSYLEIGSRFGGTFAFTTEYLRKACGLSKATAYDLLNSPFLHAYSKHEYASFICGNSHSDTIRSIMEPADLALIDGDHTYAGARMDFDFCRSIGCKMIALHDICDEGFENGVRKLWLEIKHSKAYDCYDFVNQYGFNINFMGIGLAIRRES